MPAKKTRRAPTRGKKVVKKATARRTTTKKTTARKITKKVAPKTTAISKAFSKSEILSHLAERTELSKKQISEVFVELEVLMNRHLRKRGIGEFTVPSLMKCKVKRKPATKARKGINPFTGEEMMFKAKPARNVVKVTPLKKLKEMVE